MCRKLICTQICVLTFAVLAGQLHPVNGLNRLGISHPRLQRVDWWPSMYYRVEATVQIYLIQPGLKRISALSALPNSASR